MSSTEIWKRIPLKLAILLAIPVFIAEAQTAPNIKDVLLCPNTPLGQQPYSAPQTLSGDLRKIVINSPNAVCNDGTPAVIYVRPATPGATEQGGPSENRWIIHFLGGSSCSGYEDCSARWCGLGQWPGTLMTTAWESAFTNVEGLLGRNNLNRIGDRNEVLLKYCSSDNWQGRKSNVVLQSATDSAKAYSIHFQGANILSATLDALEKGVTGMPKLTDATDVLISGDSAGATGVRAHLDRIAARLRGSNPNVRVRGQLEATFSLDNNGSQGIPAGDPRDPSFAGKSAKYNRVQVGQLNAQLDDSCVAAHPAPATYLCADDSYLELNHITTPFFQIQDIQDPITVSSLQQAGVGGTPAQIAQRLDDQIGALANIRNTAVEKASINFTPGTAGRNCRVHVTYASDDGFLGKRIRSSPAAAPYSYYDLLWNWMTGALPSNVVAPRPPAIPDTPDTDAVCDAVAPTSQPGTCLYGLSAGGQAFSPLGGSGSVTVNTSPGCAWSVSNLPSWVTLTGSSSGVGRGVVNFHVSPTAAGGVFGSFTIAGHTFTVEQTLVAISGLASVGSLAQVASEGTWKFTLDALNLGASPAQTRFTFLDNNGAALPLPMTFPQSGAGSGPLLAASLDRTINSNAQLIMESTGPANVTPLVGWGQLLSTGAVGGFGIFSNPTSGWNAVVPLETRSAPSYLLAFDNTGPLSTGVAVANLLAQAANIIATIRDDTGAILGTPQTISLPALGHTSFMLNAQYPATANKRGSIEFDTPPGGQISVLGLRANGPALTTLPVLANVASGGGAIAHATYNGGFTSTFYVVNTGTSAAQLTLSFFDENGTALAAPLFLPQFGTAPTTSVLSRALAAGAMLVVETRGQDTQPSVVGSAQLTSTGNVSGFEIFRWNTFGQEASVPLENRTPASFVLVFDDTDGMTTGVALANLASSATSVTVNLRDDTGAALAAQPISLPAHGHTSFLLPDNYPSSANRRGMVEFVVPSGGKISVIGLRATPDGTLTTIPVLTR